MNLEYDADQLSLRATVRELAADRHADAGRSTDEFLAMAASVGLIGAALPEASGGAGLSVVESMSVHELVGGALLREPLLSHDISAELIARQGDEHQQARWLPEVMGDVTLPFAHQEDAPSGDIVSVAATATESGDGHLIDGTKTMVLDAGRAAAFLVSARDAAGTAGVYRVAADGDGVQVDAYDLIDGRSAADLTLRGARGERLGGQDASEAIAYVIDYLLLALSSELLGVAEAALARTTEYVTVREQFGQPIGQFQAVRHKVADMIIETEQSRSMLLYGLAAMGDDPAARRTAMRLTKGKIGRSVRRVTSEACQLHGGLGMTQEYEIGQLFQRAVCADVLLGPASRHFHLHSLERGPSTPTT